MLFRVRGAAGNRIFQRMRMRSLIETENLEFGEFWSDRGALIKNGRKNDLKFCNDFYPVHSSKGNDDGNDFRALCWQDCAINLDDPSSVH